jgi:hypothetical protein
MVPGTHPGDSLFKHLLRSCPFAVLTPTGRGADVWISVGGVSPGGSNDGQCLVGVDGKTCLPSQLLMPLLGLRRSGEHPGHRTYLTALPVRATVSAT